MPALLDLLFPPRCPGCGREGVALCDSCALPLSRRRGQPPGTPLGLLTALPRDVLQLEWCATYSGTVRASLHALKYGGERRLIETLAGALAERWLEAGVGGDLMTWVPVHPARRRDRGFDQAEDLAVALAKRLRLPAVACLERALLTTAQHGLDQRERAGNVGGAFIVPTAARETMRGRWIIVVDDIVTTGATLAGCAAALRSNGARGVSALAVARDR